ncbi:MAG: diacylglycerol kinase family lipid kinase [Oscillospiraceae bacterium]|nr:diacylglycerol kinase family lipid kinase [Oscillospiraceae bacterium]
MEHIFVINPAAGPSDATHTIQEAIAKSVYSANCEIYLTKGPGDATDFVQKTCSQSSEPLRFYACGGDGTLNEVVNGVVNYPNAGVGCFPCGSGNDFVKYYGGAEGFLDIDNLICGEEHPIDLILANGKYCINVLNFGFDTAVLKTMEKVKTNWLFHGKRAYFAGVITALMKSMKTPCKVTVDGEVISDDNILLCTVSNGRYVGSSFQCAPRSENDDGLLEVCLVKPFSRLTFVQLMSDYSKGKHLDNPKFKDYIVYRRGKQISVEGGTDFSVALDGELLHNSKVSVAVVEKAIKFVVPRGISVASQNTVLTANQ